MSFDEIMRRAIPQQPQTAEGKLSLADITSLLQDMYAHTSDEPLKVHLRVYQANCPCPACGNNCATQPMHYAHWMCLQCGTCYWAYDNEPSRIAFTSEQDIMDEEGNVSLYWMDIRQAIIEGKGQIQEGE